MMNKLLSRVTSSARGENFNPLTWPFLLATFAYGVGFSFFTSQAIIGKSSLFTAMVNIWVGAPFVWGAVAVLTIIIGLTFLMFNIPPAGKISGLIGFMLWVFAIFCWIFYGNLLLVFSVGIPNAWFWVWQYLSLSHFRHEDSEDKQTMVDYDAGGYDDMKRPVEAKEEREDNRGVDPQ